MSAAWAEVPREPAKAVSAAPRGTCRRGRRHRPAAPPTRTADVGTQGRPRSPALGESPAHSQLFTPCPLPSGIRRQRTARASSRAAAQGLRSTRRRWRVSGVLCRLHNFDQFSFALSWQFMAGIGTFLGGAHDALFSSTTSGAALALSVG
jgi:hypothetical protein